ncbi:MAG TPA: peptidylprolyl isomerase [Acidimicrobiia bacterium]|nr:peptidylprolyl isomerase [Acidimicrobiia bacterium]
MKKLASLLVLAALVLAACGGGSNATVATVNGEDVTLGEIEALIDPGEETTIAKDVFARFLGFDIQQRIVLSAAEGEFGIVIAEDDIAAEADAIFEEANVEGVSREEFLASNGITEELLTKLAHQQLLDTQIREMFAAETEDPTQEEIDGVITESEALYCSSHILVATEEEANDVLDRIEGGEEFADLAAELSTDTGSGAQGGDLGCTSPDQYVTEFADALVAAEVGVPTEPVETEFGFHIILLGEDVVPSNEEIIEQLRTTSIGTATNEWFAEQVENAEVTVDDSYGTWEASPVPQVVPPTE